MENIIYSIGWVSESQTHAYRLALKNDHVWLEYAVVHTRASKRKQPKKSIRKSDWTRCSIVWDFCEVIGLPSINDITIPVDRWGTLTYQLSK
jgi:hypothetical protein